MRKLSFLISLMLMSLIQGCYAFRDIPLHEIRAEKYFHSEEVLDMSISEIKSRLYAYNNKCPPVSIPSVDPDNPNEGVIIMGTTGNSSLSTLVVMDFIESENRTTVRTYVYAQRFYKWAKNVIPAAKNPAQCL